LNLRKMCSNESDFDRMPLIKKDIPKTASHQDFGLYSNP